MTDTSKLHAHINPCRLLEELKTKYEGDKSNLTIQVQELQSQKPHLEVQLVTVTTENNRLQIHVKTLDKLLKYVPCTVVTCHVLLHVCLAYFLYFGIIKVGL
jgi:hypothetical protein